MFSDFTQFSYQVYTLCCSYTCIENVYVLNVRLIALCRGTILSLVSSSLLAAFNLSHCSACHNTRVSSSANQKPVSSPLQPIRSQYQAQVQPIRSHYLALTNQRSVSQLCLSQSDSGIKCTEARSSVKLRILRMQWIYFCVFQIDIFIVYGAPWRGSAVMLTLMEREPGTSLLLSQTFPAPSVFMFFKIQETR